MKTYLKQLSKLHSKSEIAISELQRIEQQLIAHNAELDSHIDALESNMSEITTIWNQAKARKAENKQFIEWIAEIARH